jgi:hypothetical protein
MDWLGIKFGAYPRSLMDDIRPVVDISDIVGVNAALEIVLGTTAVNAVGYFNQQAVPPGETWYVAYSCVSVLPALGAAEQISFALEVQADIALGVFRPLRHWPSDSPTAAGVYRPVASAPDPFWLPSGQIIGTHVQKITTAATITLNQYTAIIRCRR